MQQWKFKWFDRVDELGQEYLSVAENAGPPSIEMNLSKFPFSIIFRSLIGADAPPFLPINEPVPLSPGSFLKFVDVQENELDLTLLIQGQSQEDLYNILNGSKTTYLNGMDTIQVPLSHIFSPTKLLRQITLPDPINEKKILTGNGKLQVTTPAGNTRDLICRCISGFNVNESQLQFPTAFCTLQFYANDPFWRNSEVSTVSINNTDPVPSALVPLAIFPVGANVDFDHYKKINVLGDYATPPIFTLEGPATNPEVLNQTTGKRLSIITGSSGSPNHLGALETLVIDMLNKKVYKLGFEEPSQSWNRYITVTSEFWDLVPGYNIVEGRLNGNNEATFFLEYFERYMGVY